MAASSEDGDRAMIAGIIEAIGLIAIAAALVGGLLDNRLR
jgi:hypothetical protein